MQLQRNSARDVYRAVIIANRSMTCIGVLPSSKIDHLTCNGRVSAEILQQLQRPPETGTVLCYSYPAKFLVSHLILDVFCWALLILHHVPSCQSTCVAEAAIDSYPAAKILQWG
jgi:hypothetical protein